MATATTSRREPAPLAAATAERPTAATARAARRLSAAVVVLLAASSLAGLLVDGLYREPASVVAMLRGYDLAGLVAAVPVLAVTLVPSLRDAMWARLMAAGTVAFVVYDYAYYVFGTGFNDLFLLHVATFATAVFALILSLSSMDVTGVALRVRPRTPVRTVAIVLGLLAASLAGLWISGSLGFAISGTVPDDGNVLVYPIEMTHLGYTMDLAFLVPAYGLAAVLLWRRRPWGLVLGVVMLVAGAFTQLTYVAAMVFQSRADIAGASAFDPFAPVILGTYVVGAWLLLANLRPGPETASGEVLLT